MDAKDTTTQGLLTEIKTWAEAGLIPEANLGAVTLLTTMDEPDEFMVTTLHNAIAKAVDGVKEEKVKAKADAESKKEFKTQFTEQTTAKWDEMVKADKDTDKTIKAKTRCFTRSVAFATKVKNADGETEIKHTKSKDKVIVSASTLTPTEINYALNAYLTERDDWVKTQMKPKKSKKKGSGGKSKKDMYNKEAIHKIDPNFTKEKAEAAYETEKGYWFKDDAEAKCVFEDKKKYKEGQKDPLGGGKVNEDFYLVKYRPVIFNKIRDGCCANFVDCADDDRCQGAIGFKPMRHASQYARTKGFIGDCVVQCSEDNGGDTFCAACAKKGNPNIFDYQYKKSGKNASSFYGDDAVASR